MKALRRFSYPLTLLLLFLLYFFFADFGLRLDAVGGFASLFWLPTGLSLAAVILLGSRVFPAILLGAFTANYVHGAPFAVSSSIALGNTLEAVVGAYLLHRFVDFHPSLERLKDVLGLIVLAGLISTLISATIGVTSLFLGGVLDTPFLSTFVAWWMGNVISNLIFAPFLLVWDHRPRITFQPRRMIEVVGLIGAIILISVLVFYGLFGIRIPMSPLTYIVFPPLIWAALRFGSKEVATAVFFLALFAVWSTVNGHGPFARRSLNDSLLFLQGFMLVVSATSLILSAAVTERRSLERRKDDFISFASHELKTPITSLKISTQIIEKMLKGKDDKRTLLHMRRMDKQVNRLIALINNMLDVSKIQRSSLELTEERFLLPELINEIAETIQNSTNRTIVRKWQFKGEVVGDRERIGQVIANLLSNAAKYSPRGGKIVVTTKPSGRSITVSIKDHGVGIPKEYQSKIFDRFYRIPEGRPSLPGLGIGLYLSSMIIKLHDGDMWVESKEGKGSTFSFSIPRNSS